jgi:hypothetical protein
LAVERDKLLVRLSFLEAIAAFRGDVRIPLSCVEQVTVESRPWRALRGFRAPGTGLPGVIAYGIRLATGGSPDFAALHGRGPAVRVECRPGAAFGRLLVTVEDPDATTTEIRRALA